MNYALRRTMPARWAHLGAMHLALDRRDLHAVGEHLCIIDYAPTHGRPMVCNINGEYIARADWWQPVRPGDVVVFAEIAGEGDAGRLIATIATIVLSVWAPGAAGLTGWQAAAASAAINIAGTLLVNALFPIEQPTGQTQGETSPTYSATLEGNRPRLNQPVPVRYGQELFFPDFACPAYSEFSGDESDMYYCTGLSVGLGEYNILGIYIDDTPIQHFQDAEVAIIGPGMAARNQPTGYDGFEEWADQSVIETGMVTSLEVAGQEIVNDTWIGPFTVTIPGAAIDRIFFDLVFPRGIGTLDNTGAPTSRTIGWQMAWQPIDDNGLPTGAWVQQSGSKTAATTQAVRITLGFDAPAGRYRARVRRATVRDENDRSLNDLLWQQVRGRLAEPGISRTDLTGVAIRIRSSQQLSALTQRRIKVLAQRLVPVFNGTTWSSPQFTRNPAWALTDIWRNATYGRGLPDSRIDLDSVMDYAGQWAARQDRFDFSFDTQLTTDDAAQLVASAGRARTMLRRGAVYSVVRDEPQTEPVAVFMPRNIDRDSFSISWALPTSETPDCIAAKYRSGRYWSERVVYAQVHEGQIYGYAVTAAGTPLRPVGVPAPTLIEEVELKGVIGEKQAIRQAVYLLARSLYRRTSGAFTADLDGLLMSMGSLIGVAHDAADWAQSGDVVDWDVDALTMTLSEPPQWTEGETHFVRLQADTGELGGAIEVTPGATQYEVVLAEAPEAAPSVHDPDRERTRYLFGPLADVQRYAIAAAIRPTSVDEVEVEFFLEDDRVHEADAAWLPVGGEIQDPLADGTQVGPGGAPGGGGGEEPTLPIANLTNRFRLWGQAGGSPMDMYTGFELGNDGVLRLTNGFVGGSSDTEPISDEWLLFGANSVEACDLFEVYFAGSASVGTLSGSPLDTWLSLHEARGITLTGAGTYGSPTGEATINVTVRDKATDTTQASCSIQLLIINTDPP